MGKGTWVDLMKDGMRQYETSRPNKCQDVEYYFCYYYYCCYYYYYYYYYYYLNLEL